MGKCWTQYEGIFKKSQKEGVGKLTLSNGDFFLGEFEGDQANGLGVYYFKDGGKVVGIWKENKLEQQL